MGQNGLLAGKVVEAGQLAWREGGGRFLQGVEAACFFDRHGLSAGQGLEGVDQAGHFLGCQFGLGATAALRQFFGRALERLSSPVGFFFSCGCIAFLGVLGGLVHGVGGRGRLFSSTLGEEPLQAAADSSGFFHDRFLLVGQLRQLPGLGFFQAVGQLPLLLRQLGQLRLGFTELFDQPRQFVFAAVGEDIDNLLQVVDHEPLVTGRLADAVAAEVVVGRAHA